MNITPEELIRIQLLLADTLNGHVPIPAWILTHLLDDVTRCAKLESMIIDHMAEWEDQPASHNEVMDGFKAIWDFVSAGRDSGITVLPQGEDDQ